MSILLDGTAGESLSGNLTFTGTGQRITGDFSNSTQSNRVTFQSSTTNGVTGLEAIPNGTGGQSQFTFCNSTDNANTSIGQIYCGATNVSISSDKRGTGSYLPLSFNTNGIGQMAIAVDGTITGSKGNLQLISGTAVASTSGTSITFTGIPSWVKRITVMLNVVSLSGTSTPTLKLGVSGGIQSTGYTGIGSVIANSGATGTLTSTTYFPLTAANAAAATDTYSGLIVIGLLDTTNNIWTINGNLYKTGATPYLASSAGTVTLTGICTQLAITTVNGTDTFDAGSINILYE